MTSATLYSGLFIALLSLYAIRLYAKKSSLPLPPGPPALPIIGNVHQAPKSHPWLQYHAWGKTYGPVVYLNMLGQPVIVLGTSTAAHDLLAKRGATFSDRPRFVVAAELALKGFHMLLRPYDERFRLHQKLESPVLSVRAANAYLPFQELETKQLLYDLLKNAGGNGTNCHGYFERTTSSIIYALFYGFRLKTSSDPVLLAAHSVNHEFDQLAQVGKFLVDSFPVLDNLPGFLAPWKAEAEQHWGRQRALHVGNLQTGYKARGWNFSKHMRKSLDQEAIEMSIDELALDVGIMADAALDASTETLMWFVVACITSDRGFVITAQNCLDSVVGCERLPNFQDRTKLPYIDAIVEELLRWRPAGAAGVPHYTKVESVYNGCRIPANSVVIPNHWSISREEAVYGSNVEEFEPERWLSTESSGGVHSTASGLKDLPQVGFGYGRRICPGRHVARNVLWISIARLLWAFDVEAGVSDAGERLAVDPMAATDGLVTKPLPFKAAFRPRGKWVEDIVMNEGDTHGIDFAKILERVGAEIAPK
ncbi:cytochrome P450 [Lentithecium fluviatile CBS 122367]|uniref:Cytochrome P450 n=1 Tax=Lentithecium fluviatile CBS 122367 TaxID=1168545 RepID=A0A6G1J0R9_9PLEO|nr:cytochrome P450 [Lentithecium fluviatile CBS 122367]